MDNSVIIKGNKNGIVVVLDDSMDFAQLAEKVAGKFADSAKFLGSCKTAVAFEGRALSGDEELQLAEIISNNTNLDIVCILSNDSQKNIDYEQAVSETIKEAAFNTAKFYKGNLRSGQVLEMENSIIVIGDVNPGASVVSNGNILILGALKGIAHAGASGNRNAFVFALDMNPMQIHIADVIARSPDNPDRNQARETKIAFLEEDSIYIEPVSKSVLNDIRLG